jgi:hypothetical protein
MNNPDVSIEKGYYRLLWFTLSLNVFLKNPRNIKSEVQLLPKKIMTYLKFYRSLIGPQRETRLPCDLRLVKFYCLAQFPSQYRKFGKTYNYFQGFFESCIKTMIKRNLARTTSNHGRSVEDLIMRYFEQKVCDFAVVVLHTNSKNMEILITKAKEIPTKRESSLNIMSDSGFYVVCDDVTSKCCTRGKKLDTYQHLIHPLVSSPEENTG